MRIRARRWVDEQGVKHYEIYGPLFFGSASTFQDKFDPRSDPSEVAIDFKDSRIADHSGIEAVQKVTSRYQAEGKRVRLRHLSPDCVRLLRNAGPMIDVNYFEDPHYVVVMQGDG